MDTKSKLLVAAFIVIVAAAIFWKYDTFVTQRDFLVHDQVSCDPSTESCFSYDCDEGDEECDAEPFKKIRKSARNIPLCPNYTGGCPELACLPGEEECEVTYCSDEDLEEDEICVSSMGEDVEPSEEGAMTEEEPTEE